MTTPPPNTPSQHAFIALQHENEKLKNTVLDLQAEVRRLQALAGHAELPGVLSRPEFIREVARMIAHDQRYGAASSLLSISLDGLDEGKKALGHQEHDNILTMVSDTLTHSVRNCDIVGRTGVEDFGIFLTRCKEADARTKATQLLTKIKERIEPLLKGKITLSVRFAVRLIQDKADLEKIRR